MSTMFDKDTVLEAIKDSGGIMSTIAQRLHCNWNTAKKYTEKWEETQQAMKDEKETILDVCESTLINKIKDGDEQSAKWYLSKIGKLRGYGDSLALEGGIQIVYADKDDERL